MNELRAAPLAPISVAICTCDRPDTVGRAIQSVLDQEYPDFELIVLDQSQTDTTEWIVSSLMAGRDGLRYVRLLEKGLSRAYNAAAASARYDLMAFTDDDCVVAAGWLAAVAAAFVEHPDAGLVYGQVLGPLEPEQLRSEEGEIPTLPIERLERLSHREGFKIFGMGANFAVRRAVVMRLGGFDEVLGGGGPLQSAQDFDFEFRVYRDGGTVVLDPRLVVHHYGFRAHADWPATFGSYGVGVGGFYLKHIRAGDAYAAMLLAREWVIYPARLLKRLLLGQPTAHYETYLRHLAVGMRQSFKYRVDRRRRLYRLPNRGMS